MIGSQTTFNHDRSDSMCESTNFMCLSTALPVASVSVSPQGLLYSGETVSLQCVIPDYTDWMFLWFRDNQQFPSQTSKSITFPITQTGQYRCEGKRRDHPQRSQPSDYVTISVTGKFPTIACITISV